MVAVSARKTGVRLPDSAGLVSTRFNELKHSKLFKRWMGAGSSRLCDRPECLYTPREAAVHAQVLAGDFISFHFKLYLLSSEAYKAGAHERGKRQTLLDLT